MGGCGVGRQQGQVHSCSVSTEKKTTGEGGGGWGGAAKKKKGLSSRVLSRTGDTLNNALKTLVQHCWR